MGSPPSLYLFVYIAGPLACRAPPAAGRRAANEAGPAGCPWLNVVRTIACDQRQGGATAPIAAPGIAGLPSWRRHAIVVQIHRGAMVGRGLPMRTPVATG